MSSAPFQFLPVGAIIQSFHVGETNIVQGFPKQAQYDSYNSPHFGETIGRVANRISGAKINSLNGRSYVLAANDGVNSLHGGNVGWGKLIWDGPAPAAATDIPGVEGLEGGKSVKFSLRSEDGNEGYPGTVYASVLYTTGTQTVDGKKVTVLGIEYEVKLGDDQAVDTVVNITNHSYFNLGGTPTIEGTQVSLSRTDYLPLDAGGIPISTNIVPYDGIRPNETFTLGATTPKFDDCFVVDPSAVSSIPLDTRSSTLNSLTKAYHATTKIHLEVLSTEPAFQFYTGEHIDVPEVEGVPARVARSGFCVEPSRFVNAINVPDWKRQVVLSKDKVYGSRIVFRGWSDE